MINNYSYNDNNIILLLNISIILCYNRNQNICVLYYSL